MLLGKSSFPPKEAPGSPWGQHFPALSQSVAELVIPRSSKHNVNLMYNKISVDIGGKEKTPCWCLCHQINHQGNGPDSWERPWFSSVKGTWTNTQVVQYTWWFNFSHLCRGLESRTVAMSPTIALVKWREWVLWVGPRALWLGISQMPVEIWWRVMTLAWFGDLKVSPIQPYTFS